MAPFSFQFTSLSFQLYKARQIPIRLFNINFIYKGLVKIFGRFAASGVSLFYRMIRMDAQGDCRTTTKFKNRMICGTIFYQSVTWFFGPGLSAHPPVSCSLMPMASKPKLWWGAFLGDGHYVSVWSLRFQRLFRKASVLLSEKLPLAQSKPDIIELLPTRVEQVVIYAVSKGAVE